MDDCLSSLTVQDEFGSGLVQILVIDNYHNLQNHKELSEICAVHDYIDLVWEKKPGLSNARNMAIKKCSTEYIGFLDDDCIASSNYLKVCINTIQNFEFSCFGGHIASWWKFGRVKWLPENYGEKPKLAERTVPIQEGYIWGGNMVYRLSSLIMVGGFPVGVGMQAKKLGYGAENIVQINMRKLGETIGYIPDLIVKHIVSKEKLHVSWHIRAAYATSRDGRDVFPEQYTFKHKTKEFLRFPIIVTNSCYSLLFRPRYYVQNFILDVGGHLAKLVGSL